MSLGSLWETGPLERGFGQDLPCLLNSRSEIITNTQPLLAAGHRGKRSPICSLLGALIPWGQAQASLRQSRPLWSRLGVLLVLLGPPPEASAMGAQRTCPSSGGGRPGTGAHRTAAAARAPSWGHRCCAAVTPGVSSPSCGDPVSWFSCPCSLLLPWRAHSACSPLSSPSLPPPSPHSVQPTFLKASPA